jgi:hypothetical protein
MTEQDTGCVISAKLIEELVEVLRDLRNAVDPVEPIRPLNIDEAARALRCRRSEVEGLIDSGAMPHISRSGRRYILPSDIGQWLRNESERKSPRRNRKVTASRIDMEDVDPALREFFD